MEKENLLRMTRTIILPIFAHLDIDNKESRSRGNQNGHGICIPSPRTIEHHPSQQRAMGEVQKRLIIPMCPCSNAEHLKAVPHSPFQSLHVLWVGLITQACTTQRSRQQAS